MKYNCSRPLFTLHSCGFHGGFGCCTLESSRENYEEKLTLILTVILTNVVVIICGINGHCGGLNLGVRIFVLSATGVYHYALFSGYIL